MVEPLKGSVLLRIQFPFALFRRLLLLLPIPTLLLGGAVPNLICCREDFIAALWLWYN